MEDEDPFFPLFAKQDPSGFEYELPKENEEESIVRWLIQAHLIILNLSDHHPFLHTFSLMDWSRLSWPKLRVQRHKGKRM